MLYTKISINILRTQMATRLPVKQMGMGISENDTILQMDMHHHQLVGSTEEKRRRVKDRFITGTCTCDPRAVTKNGRNIVDNDRSNRKHSRFFVPFCLEG